MPTPSLSSSCGSPHRRITCASVFIYWILALALTASLSLRADVLAAWNTSTQPGGSGNFGVSPLPATTVAPHLATAGFVRGTGVGVSGTGAARGWGGNNWTSTSQTGAVSANQLASCTIDIETGYTASFSSISKFDYRRSASGPATGVLQYRLGNDPFVDLASLSFTSTASSGGSISPISLSSVAALQNVAGGTSVTFRIVNYGGTASSGTWYIYDAANSTAADFAIEGTVSTAQNVVLSATGSLGDSNLALGENATLTVQVIPATTPASTGITVTADLTAFGGAAADPLTATGPNTYTTTVTVPANASTGPVVVTINVVDQQARTATAAVNATVRGDLNIIHINDTHTRVPSHQWVVPEHGTNLNPQFEEVGGVAVLTGKMLQLAGARPDSLVLDGGDISEGNPLGDWDGPGNPIGSFGNAVMVDFYKLLDQKLRTVPGRGGRGLDAMVVGNHDIRSINYINNLKNQTDFPVISANICQNGTKIPYFAPYVIVNVNGNKVGILGYTTESADSSDPVVTAAIDVVKCDWTSTDSTKIHFADYVNELRNVHGCNIVILLTHMGHSGLCTPTFSNPTPILVDDNAAKLPEIAVTGHWHTYCDTAWQPSALNYKTIFTEAGSYTHYIGELLVNGQGRYKSSLYHPLRHSTIAPDPDMLAYVDTRKAQFAAANPQYGLYQVIGYTADDLLLDNDLKWWSTNEYPWSGNHTAGNWICDAVQWRAQQLFGACDLAIEAGGGVRSDIPAGPVTYMQIYETFPWADDLIWRVNMTGQEIWNYIREHGCSVGLSAGWHVSAYDGVPTAITRNGQPLNLAQTYAVAINNYMYAHDTVPFSDQAPLQSSVLSRDAIIAYTAQFTQANPYRAGNSRYSLNTEFAGGYRGVITMMNDGDTKTAFQVGFIRLLSANAETLARRGTKSVPTNLVRADGTVLRSNRLAENQLYRSYLGFKTGALQPGDIVEVWGKGAFYEGNPEFVDQEGIKADGVEFNIVGHDNSLAQPIYMPSINSFWVDDHENHYVRFFARKSGTSTVTDQEGTTITVYDKTGYATRSLPGASGDLLVLTGVATSENYSLRLRSDTVAAASTVGVTSPPPGSSIDAQPEDQNGASLNLTATAAVAPGSGTTTYTLIPTADTQVARGLPSTNYGTSTSSYVQSSNTGSFLDERVWYKFDLSSIPSGTSFISAKLKAYCWKAAGAALPTSLHQVSNDAWTETGLNWNGQPTLGAQLSSRTLAAGTTNVWYDWDATSFVQSEFSGDKVVSLALKATTEGSTDATAPSYALDTKEYTAAQPYLEVKAATGGGANSITQVEFFYRYSANNSTWTSWSSLGTTSGASPSMNFNYPQGDGYYEFYSIATDNTGAVEPAPAFADLLVHKSANLPATVNLSGLSATYTGQSHAVTVTTVPTGLAYTLTYDGLTTEPINAGSYQVTATVTAPGYLGSAQGTLVIAPTTQTITFPPIGTVNIGDQVSLQATTTSGLPITYSTSDAGVIAVSGNTATVIASGLVTITAQQSGSANFLPTSLGQSVTVSSGGTGGTGSGSGNENDIPFLPWWAVLGTLAAMVGLARRRR